MALQLVRVPGPGGMSPGGGVTPGLVNFNGAPGSQTNAMGARQAGSVTCVANAYCTQLVDPSLAGNAIIVFYTYKAASGNTANQPTISDDKSNSYTHCGTDANDSTHDIYLGCFYKLNATTGTRAITVTWSAATTQVAVAAGQFAGLSAADGYNTGASTSNVTTFSSGSITPSGSGDFFCEAAQASNTHQNVGAFTAGSQSNITWAMHLADRRDGMAVQCGTYNSAAALNPQMTIGTSNAYVALGQAFTESTSQGTNPTGMYIAHQYHYNSASATTGPFAVQMPVSGNLIVVQQAGGGATPMTLSSISDGTNTYTNCNNNGSQNFFSGGVNQSSATFYAANAIPGFYAVTLTTSGTGDIGPTMLTDIAGAATSQDCNYVSQMWNSSTNGNTTAYSNYAPGSSAGITLAVMSQNSNTTIGVTAPSSPVGYIDVNTVGSENLDGPYPVDENNAAGHWYHTANTPVNLTWTETNSIGAVAGINLEIASFPTPSATRYPHAVQAVINNAGSGTTVTASVTPKYAGSTLAVYEVQSATSGTITCSDPTNGSYTAVDGPTNLAGQREATFYMKNIAITAVTITCTHTAGAAGIFVVEVANASTTAPLDQHNLEAKTSNASTGVITGTAVTTTSANECAVGFANVAGTAIRELGFYTAAYPWTVWNYDTGGNPVETATLGAAGSVSTLFIDSNTNASDSSAIMTFK